MYLIGTARRFEGLARHPSGVARNHRHRHRAHSRPDVQAAASFEAALRREDVRVDAAVKLAVKDRRPRIVVRLQPGPTPSLELVHDCLNLFVGGLVLRCPRDHPGGVPVLEVERIGHCDHRVRVPANDFDALARLPGRVPLAEEVGDRSLGGALAVGGTQGASPPSPPGCGPPRATHARTIRNGRSLRRPRPLSGRCSSIAATTTWPSSSARTKTFRGRRGNSRNRPAAKAVDQDSERLPPQPHHPQPQGDQQDRLDQDRPDALRPVPGQAGLRRGAREIVGRSSWRIMGRAGMPALR